ncbi:MAG: hypothetical protein Q4A97_07540 [Comamonadaceae bacterium]|nr:hypothetical protein [Comamonadaceae bacterium]
MPGRSASEHTAAANSASRWRSAGWVLLYLSISALALARSLPWWEPVYAHTAWYFDYTQGFVKRGLAGELLRLAGLAPTHGTLRHISLGLSAAFWLGASLLLWRLYQRSGRHSGMAWLALVFASSSATWQHWLIDAGRLDHLLLALALAGMALLATLQRPALAFALVLPLNLLALLVHEAALLLFIPLLLAWWRYRQGPAARGWILACAALSALAAALIAALGTREPLDFAADFARQQARAGGWLVAESYAVPYQGGLRHNVQLSLQRLGDVRQHYYHLELLLLCLLPHAWLLWQAGRRPATSTPAPAPATAPATAPAPTRPIQWRNWLLACLAPCLLYAVSIDFYRWWAWAICNLYLAAMLLCLCDAPLRTRLAQTLAGQRAVLLYLIASALLMGGLGPDNPYPLLTLHTRWGEL